MKKIISLLSLSLVFLLFTNFGKMDTSSFKTSKFLVKAGEFTTYIERFEKYQIEHTPGKGVKLKSKITWETDTHYYISDYEVLENSKNEDVSFIEGDSNIYFEITKMKKKYIKTEVRMSKNSNPFMKLKYYRQ